jgi:hypothetical protein
MELPTPQKRQQSLAETPIILQPILAIAAMQNGELPRRQMTLTQAGRRLHFPLRAAAGL